MSTTSLNRIRILKTGLANVQNHIDMEKPKNRSYFERLAEPGTQLKLKRVREDENDPCRIDVYSPDDRYLGHVTLGKNETTARLMDAGLKVAAIVNSSMPVHDSDISIPQAESDVQDSRGWDEESRIATQYEDCNLPYCIYIRRTRYNMERYLIISTEDYSQMSPGRRPNATYSQTKSYRLLLSLAFITCFYRLFFSSDKVRIMRSGSNSL